jgi:sugar/nucleoside kinase (ribokinase family)
MKAVCLGVHVLDVLAYPIEAIPEGQGGQLVEEIRLSAAGSAGGTALVLAKLGAQVRSAGAVGSDVLGDVLIDLLRRGGVNTDLLLRRVGPQTSASVLPIRADGSRPAFHVPGANIGYSSADAPWDAIAEADHLHLGAPEFMGGVEAAKICEFAHAHGTTTSADLLVPGDQAASILEWILPCFPHLDYLLPNDDQVRGLSGEDDLAAGCRALLAHGVGCVAATAGAEGALVVDPQTHLRVAALEAQVVDTSGCGDAFSAGFLRGVAAGDALEDAARLGCAAASFVIAGLGSDHGSFSLADVRQRAAAGAV